MAAVDDAEVDVATVEVIRSANRSSRLVLALASRGNSNVVE